jgi:hypothetical protein
LRGVLDDVERKARAAGGNSWHVDHFGDCEGPCGCRRIEADDMIIYDEGGHTEHHAEHIAEHDPSRVLREVEAKRRLIAEYERALAACRAHPDDLASAGWLLALVRVLKIVAQPFSDRPGFREEWRAA